MASIFGELLGAFLGGALQVGANAALSSIHTRNVPAAAPVSKSTATQPAKSAVKGAAPPATPAVAVAPVPTEVTTTTTTKTTIPLRRNIGSVTLPCVTAQGAMEDLMFVIIWYEQMYSGTNKFGAQSCFSRLPTALQQAHRALAEELKANSDLDHAARVLKTSLFSGRSFTQPRSIEFPCTDSNHALSMYDKIVLNYPEYSGRGCWYLLPSSVKAIMCKHINDKICPVYNKLAKAQGQGLPPCKYKCSTSFSLFGRSKFGGSGVEDTTYSVLPPTVTPHLF